MGIEYKLDETTTDRYIIFSVFHFLEDSDTNADNTNSVQAKLDNRCIPYRKIYGKYRGEFKYSFIVNQDYLQTVKEIAARYHQECILLLGEAVVNNVRPVQVLYINTDIINPIGFLGATDREDALSNNDYMYDYELDQYFITTKGCANVIRNRNSI